jgi:hypothetical protein
MPAASAYRQVVQTRCATKVRKMSMDSPAVRSQIASPPPAVRSRVTNHRDLLPGLDGRSSAARRFRDLVAAFINDMGGAEQCSDIKLGLLRRLAAVTVQAEVLEARMINGQEVDVGTLCTLASTTVRLSQRLGIERVPRDVTQSLDDILREHQQP